MTRTHDSIALIALIALAASGCAPASGGSADDVALHLQPLESPAPAGSAEPNITAGPDGFYLSWLERVDEGRHALRFARLTDEGWSAPRTVMERGGLFVNWADFPSMIALEDGTLIAHWLEKSGEGTYAYDVRMAASTDGGASWGEDIVPHRDGVQAEHGFVSLFPVEGEPGRAGAVWLDGRGTVRGEPMTLRFATVGADGASADELVDASVCDCCQTSAAVAAGDPLIVYRDRTEGEVRDIYAVRRVDGQWTDPVAVHDDGWVINACPVNGPAVAADGRRAAVAWFTGSPTPRVNVAFSDDAGATFGAPIRVDGGEAQGRVGVVLLDDGSALVSWLERATDGAEIRLRRVQPATTAATRPATDSTGILRLAATSTERASGFPRMARMGDRILFAWTEAGNPSRVKTAVGTLGPPEGR